MTEPEPSPRESNRTPIVGVSRRFGTGHMLVAVGLFAPLFGILQALDTPPVGYAFCALFCASIPLGQVFLYQGRRPRRASCLVGTRLLPLLVVGGIALVEAPDLIADLRLGGFYDELAGFVLVLLLVFAAMAGLGYALGYVIGTISAGVFLVVDQKWNAGRRGEASSSDVEAEEASTDAALDVPAAGRWWLDWIAWSPVQWFWKGRNRPVRNAMVLTFLAAVPLAIGIPISHSGGYLKAYLIGSSIASPLIGLVLSGLLLVHWRMPLIFCALGVAGVVCPLSQIKELWVPRWFLDSTHISFPALTFYSGTALGLMAAGFYGWVRWLLPERANSRGGWRLGLLVGAGLAAVLLFLGTGARYMADSPRERVLREIDLRGVFNPSPFNIQFIFCDSEDLSEDALRNIDAIGELEFLELRYCKISKEGMQAIGRLANLQHLSLVDCRFAEGSCKGLRSLGTLVRLDLSASNVLDEDLQVLRHLPVLNSLHLIETPIDGNGLKHLAGLTNLTTMDIRRTNVRGENLKYLRKIAVLYLAKTPIRNDDLAYLADSQSITGLDLSGTGISDDGLEHLAGLKQLEYLTLDGTKITGLGLLHLKNLKNLTGLNLGHSQLNNEGLTHLPALPALTSLSLVGTKVTGDGLRHIRRLPMLQWLDLSECNIGDADLKQLRSFPLEWLRVDLTDVTDQAKSDLESSWQRQLLGDTDADSLDDGFKAISR